jgi:hypothetical protein
MNKSDKKSAVPIVRQSLFAAVVMVLGLLLGGQALAVDPDSVSFTLEGCRQESLPAGYDIEGNGFLCDVGAGVDGYTTGNLGKKWNELDLVPWRITTAAGNSAPATQTYDFVFVVDYEDVGAPGYDVITLPTLNTALSDSSCVLVYGPETELVPGFSGTDKSLYRDLKMTQAKNTTCVIDGQARLAVGSHLFPGASLHFNLGNDDDPPDTSGIGNKDVSIPVNEILPQEIDKTMLATQDTDFAWNITKGPNPATLSFGDTCARSGPLEEQVAIRVDWEILPGTPGMVTIVTNISATNPAARTITVHVADEIFAGTQSLDSYNCPAVDVPANTTQLVCTHTISAASDVTDLNDTAIATYIDKVTGVPVPGTTTATASAPIQPGNDTNTTAVISDSESISGTGLTFAVDSTSGAAVTCSPAIPTAPTTGPVVCTTGDQVGDGFVVFNKTVSLDEPRITSGTLSDTATLTGSDGFTASASANVSISSNAFVELKIIKRLNDDILQGEDEACFDFTVSDTDVGTDDVSRQICFDADDPLVKEVTITGLPPDTYTVTETPALGWAVDPVSDTQQQVDLNLPICSNTVTFNNQFAPANFANAQVQKVSDPPGFEAGWTFDLQWCDDLIPANCGESDYQTVSTLTSTGPGFATFLNSSQTANLDLVEGTYRIGEVTKPGWETPVATNCNDYVVDYPNSIGATFSCTYTNTKLGKIIIEKVTDPAGGTGFGFTDTIITPNSFTLDDGQMEIFLDVPAGIYEVTENDPTPAFDLVDLVCVDDFDQNGFNDNDSYEELLNLKAVIKLDPGETVKCTFTNRERGMVTVLKTVFNLVDPTQSIIFTLQGPGVNVTDNTFGDQDGILDFDMVKLIPGDTYTLCEEVPAAWSSFWKFQGNIVTPYNPDAPTQDLGNRCFDFTVAAGQTVSFVIDNQFPGGEARTPGYWKNWNRCTGGGQADNADRNGGPAEGFFLMEDVLPQTIGDLVVATCEVGVSILDTRSIDRGKKSANDAAYELARNLLAAMLNWTAGAGTCQEAQDAAVFGQALLADIDFDGTGSYLKPKPVRQQRQDALQLAYMLDEYNNNRLCPQ